MRRRIIYFLTITLLFFGTNLLVGHIASQVKPFTMGQILRAIASVNQATGNQKKVLSDKILKDIRQRKVDFQLTKDNEALLRNEGATNELIEAIRQNSPPLPTPIPTPIKTPVSIPTPTPTPTSSNNSDASKNSIGMEFVHLSRASFTMGSEDGKSDEKPIHRVTISKDFWMGKTEVTQGQWKAIMGNNPSAFKNCGNNCPVESVSWEDVQDFIKKLNAKGEGTYRLPTEAEWEYAARANTITKWSFGNDESRIGNYAWYLANSGNKTHEVGTKQPNDFGLYDMHGNVWEWCEDWYGRSYQSGSVTDPMGAGSGSRRVLRGGGWINEAVYLRSAGRSNYSPSDRSNGVGFRVVRY